MSHDNPELRLAEEFLQHTGCNIFLTGKAGTGKTTFLHDIRKKTPKRLVVTAPTGVAAINAGGVTLHSFFQLPFGPFAPGSDPLSRENHRLSKEKRNIIRSLDLLVIDEISMVRADLLDLVDTVLRRYRRFDTPFGGVQLLMIGDLHQLPPVVKEADWQILRPHYDSPYFFSSRALHATELVTIELRHIYRQSDAAFIDLLNRVRDNRLDAESLQLLNSRHIPEFAPSDEAGYITLSTHNQSADTLNTAKLQALPPKSRCYEAEIEGDFPEQLYPTAHSLRLKVGAQVMFVRNDPSPEKRYFNGRIGRIVRMTDQAIEVICPEDRDPIEVEHATWENIEYSVDPETAEISQKTIGTFAQFPLKLAWAITIHKSQGLTFDKAVIDAQAAFAHGQVYVALSRCRSLEGMVLSAPLTPAAIKTDTTVNRFVREAECNKPTGEQLTVAKIRYQQQLLLECFHFRTLSGQLGRLVSLAERHDSVLQLSGTGELRATRQQAEKEICAVGENFRRQLHSLFSSTVQPAEDPVICERLHKASAYFQEKFTSILLPMADIEAETDNKEVRKQVRNCLTRLREEIAVKLAAIKACSNGFSPAEYLRSLSTAEIAAATPATKAPAPTYTEADVGHPELFVLLKDWRRQKASEQGVQLFQIMHQKTLVQIAVQLPDSLAALKAIHGIGPKMADKYGEELVRLVGEFRKAHDIQTVSLPEKKAQPQPASNGEEEKADGKGKGDTKLTTLELHRQGKTIGQIAGERGLTTATIENHLAYYVEKGELEVGELVAEPERMLIEEIIAAKNNPTMREIREAGEGRVNYGEIRFVLAHLRCREMARE